jgi:O-antigen ligase
MGIALSTLLYFKVSIREVIRTGVYLAIFAAALVYGVKSNPAVTERVQHGYERISTGLAVLTHREGDSGATGLGNRQGWTKEGLKGWVNSPVFGHGIEAFRADHGITSHSTPIDLLYNAGLIGCGLFYAAFASLAWRLFRARNPQTRGLRARITACFIAYLFISISGLIYYESFVAIFLALSSGLLMRLERATVRGVEWDGLSVGDGGSVATA